MKKLLMALAILTGVMKAQSFEMVAKDTINMTDANGKKQGKWIVSGYNNPKSGYNSDSKIEEGFYKDNKKIGIWINYFKNGKIKSKITFLNGRPNGPSTMFYETGKIDEEGTWTDNHWTGLYKKYNLNGELLLEYVFDEKGKITKKIKDINPHNVK